MYGFHSKHGWKSFLPPVIVGGVVLALGTEIYAFFQTTTISWAVWVGVVCALIAFASAVTVKMIDVWNERRKEKEKKREKTEHDRDADDAREFLENTKLRQEERDFFNSVIARLNEEKIIASRRGHAFSGEMMRLQNQTLKLLQLWPREHEPPMGIVIFNEELNRYLAELEELPLPKLAPKPSSLQDIHRTSSDTLSLIEERDGKQ